MGCWSSKEEKRSLLPVESLIKGEIDKNLPKIQRKFILIGPPNSGKTNFFCTYKEISFNKEMLNTNPDLGTSLCHTEFFKSQLSNIMVILWDSAGSTEYLSITKNFLQGKIYMRIIWRIGRLLVAKVISRFRWSDPHV